MVLPVLQVVELICVRVLRCKSRVTERDVGGVADVLEIVELSSPWTTQTACVVYLNLLAVAYLIAEECAREELEEVPAVVAGYLAALLLCISVRACLHVPLLATQAYLVAELAYAARVCGVERVCVLLVAEYVVESLINNRVCLIGICDYWALVIREIALVTSLDAVVLVDLVLIVELNLGAGVLVLAILELVALVCNRVLAKDLGCLYVCGITHLAPLMVANREIDEVGVAPAVCVSHIHIVHLWCSLLRCLAYGAAFRVKELAVLYLAALSADVVVVLATAVHTHEVTIDLILLGESPCEASACEDVVGVVVAVVYLALVGRWVAMVYGCGLSFIVELHVTVVESAVCVELAAAEVDVHSGIISTL